MKALLLCGGFATRLEPVTYFIPKPLLPVGIAGKPVVEYALEDVVRSGVMDITISTNAKFAQAFEYWIDQKRYDIDSAKMDLIIENTQNHNEKLGGVKGIMYAITEKKIDTDLIIIAGDNLYDFSVKEVIDYFNKHRKPTIAFYDIGSKEEAKRFGVAKLEGNKVVAFEEKPAEPQSTLVSTGIYIFPRESLSIIKEYLDQTSDTDKLGDFIAWLISRTEVNGYVYKGKWYDIGTLDTYKKVFDEYTAKRNNSRMR